MPKRPLGCKAHYKELELTTGDTLMKLKLIVAAVAMSACATSANALVSNTSSDPGNPNMQSVLDDITVSPASGSPIQIIWTMASTATGR